MKEPKISSDPRFVAARKLVSCGKVCDGPAIDMFASLLEEARRVFGDSHIETAVCYYEYGNALFRAAQRKNDDNEKKDTTDITTTTNNSATNQSSSKIAKQTNQNNNNTTDTSKTDEKVVTEQKSDNEIDSTDDVQLALEMMETTYAILEEYTTTKNESVNNTSSGKKDPSTFLYLWAENQIPRVLIGIGDVLSHIGRHADAVDTYLRALPYREKVLSSFNEDEKMLLSLECLKANRLVVEINVLAAEELLACNETNDVVTTESKQVLVKRDERIDFAQGYYDKARELLQETGTFPISHYSYYYYHTPINIDIFSSV